MTTSSGSWPGGSDEAQGAFGAELGQGARGGAEAALLAALSPSKHRIGAGSSRHMRSSWRFGQRGAVGRDRLAEAGAVEGDHVHIAFDDDQAPGLAAGGAGAVEL